MARDDVEGTAEQWGRVARAIVRRRRGLKVSSRSALSRLCDGEPSERTISNLETAAKLTYRRSTLQRLSLALGWPEDGIEIILSGEAPPTPIPQGEEEVPAWVVEMMGVLHEVLEVLAELRPSDRRPPDGRGQ